MTRYHSIIDILYIPRWRVLCEVPNRGREGQSHGQARTQALPLQNKMLKTSLEEHASFEPSLMSACPCVKGRVTQPVRNSSLSCDLAPFTLPQAGNRVFIAVSYELGDLTISLWSVDPIYYLRRYETCHQKDQVREGGWGKIIWHFLSCICIFVCHCMYIHLLTEVVIAILSQVLFVNLVCTRAR